MSLGQTELVYEPKHRFIYNDTECPEDIVNKIIDQKTQDDADKLAAELKKLQCTQNGYSYSPLSIACGPAFTPPVVSAPKVNCNKSPEYDRDTGKTTYTSCVTENGVSKPVVSICNSDQSFINGICINRADGSLTPVRVTSGGLSPEDRDDVNMASKKDPDEKVKDPKECKSGKTIIPGNGDTLLTCVDAHTVVDIAPPAHREAGFSAQAPARDPQKCNLFTGSCGEGRSCSNRVFGGYCLTTPPPPLIDTQGSDKKSTESNPTLILSPNANLTPGNSTVVPLTEPSTNQEPTLIKSSQILVSTSWSGSIYNFKKIPSPTQ
jgi:hypothetical protein